MVKVKADDGLDVEAILQVPAAWRRVKRSFVAVRSVCGPDLFVR